MQRLLIQREMQAQTFPFVSVFVPDHNRLYRCGRIRIARTKMLIRALLLSLALCGCDRATPPVPTQSNGLNARSTTHAAESSVIVELPHAWQPRKPTVATVQQMADDAELQAHFTLAVQRRVEFNDDLMAWAKITKKATAEQTKLTNRTESTLKQSLIGGHSVIEYEIAGDAGRYRGVSRVFMLRIGEWFCKLTCWTTPENWKAAQPKFEELLGRLRSTGSLPRN
jgi:hypothetical protein